MPDSVLTLIAAAPATPAALDAAATSAAAALGELGARLEPPDWLVPGIACDLRFAELDPDQADAAARVALAQRGLAGIDLAAQKLAGRRKRLLVADMEATIIANEMLDELAVLLGLGERITEVTRRAMNGEIDFADALRQRVALLAGVPESALDRAEALIRVTPGAAALVATMRAHGAYTALVSGGFRRYTAGVGARLGFDIDIANELLVEEGRILGRVREPILGRDAKLAALKRLAAERGLALAACLSVGDGANDLPMLEAAGLGVAFHAKPAVVARARSRIDHGDLRALLYLQGYRQAEIIDPEGSPAL